MRTKLLIAFIAAMLMVPSAAFATDTDTRSDQSDHAVDVARAGEDARPPRYIEPENDRRPERYAAPDEPTPRCLKVSDRCCHYSADENPERCHDHRCVDTDQITDRCCLHLADDHPERCRDREVDAPNYRALFRRLFKAGEWQLTIRLLKHLDIV